MRASRDSEVMLFTLFAVRAFCFKYLTWQSRKLWIWYFCSCSHLADPSREVWQGWRALRRRTRRGWQSQTGRRAPGFSRQSSPGFPCLRLVSLGPKVVGSGKQIKNKSKLFQISPPCQLSHALSSTFLAVPENTNNQHKILCLSDSFKKYDCDSFKVW